MSRFFEEFVQDARRQAMEALESRAILNGTLISVCMTCWKFISEVDGRGTVGLSHGLCESCASVELARIKMQSGGVH